MKMWVGGAGAACLGGAALSGAMSGHDVERVVAKPPQAVYAAVSAIAREGKVRSEDPNAENQIVLKVDKELGRSIRYEVARDNEVLGELAFGFEPEGEAHTRMTVDLELDRGEVAKLGEGGANIALLPDTMVNFALSQVIEEMADDIEAGRSLPAIDNYQSRMRRQLDSDSPSERRSAAKRHQAAAVAPMASAKPMVDPKQSAREYLHGKN